MANEQPKYPGKPTVTDGTGIVVWVETNICEASSAYPITPSTNMGVGFQEAVANGQQNLWGTPLAFLELESEHSSASTCEGYAMAGGRVSNFTSGQGLILMKEVLYTIAGKRLPVVFNIGARALTSQSLNVHCGHDDIFGVLDAGWGCLFASNAQEAGDFSLISRRAAEATQTPFFNTQDGFLTTHTLENVLMPEPELMKEFVGDPREKVLALFDPNKPLQIGVVQNQDGYMKGKVAQRFYYDRVRDAVLEAFKAYGELTGRKYGMLTTHNMEDAEVAIISLGSSAETCSAVIPEARKAGVKLGTIHINCIRPFPAVELAEALKNVKVVSVLERLDVPLGASNPLTMEVKSVIFDAMAGKPGLAKPKNVIQVLSGIYGLGSRDLKPAHILAAAKNMVSSKPMPLFACGIRHPLALPDEKPLQVTLGAFAMRGHSVGGYGSVTTNKIMATLGGDVFGLKVQAYPKYGSEKKGLPTTYYLTLAQSKVLTHNELDDVNFVALNDINSFNTSNPLHGLSDGGTLFLQTPEPDPAKVWAAIPAKARKGIVDKKVKVLYLDAVKVARELAPNKDLAQRMQGIILLGVFLKSTPYTRELGLSDEELFVKVRKPLSKYFGRRGDDVVDANLNAVKRGYSEAVEIPASVAKA